MLEVLEVFKSYLMVIKNSFSTIKQIFTFSMSVLMCSFSYAQDKEKEYVFQICDQVDNPESQVGALDSDSLASLPIGIRKEIANTIYIIAIDSANLHLKALTLTLIWRLIFPVVKSV